jgi:hypothetical protein
MNGAKSALVDRIDSDVYPLDSQVTAGTLHHCRLPKRAQRAREGGRTDSTDATTTPESQPGPTPGGGGQRVAHHLRGRSNAAKPRSGRVR